MRGTKSQVDDAVKLLLQRSGPVVDSAVPTYKRLVRSVLSRSRDEEDGDHLATVGNLREVLYRIANQFRSHSVDKQLNPEMEELLMAVHYQHMLYLSKSFGLRDVAAKCAITLLKYPLILPQDKAFFQAGNICRDLGNTNFAFMLLNRFVCLNQCIYLFYSFCSYVDLTEAIETSDASFLDNSEYQDTDAIPLNGPLPSIQYLNDEVI